MNKILVSFIFAFSLLCATEISAQKDDKNKEKIEGCCKKCTCKDCKCNTDCSNCSDCKNNKDCNECKDCNHKGSCCEQHHNRHHHKGGCCKRGC